MAAFGAIAGALSDTGNAIGGTIWSANKAAKEAKKQRAWAERMSSTAYQRGMEDMRKAGLNPILAYKQGGASSPTGSVAGVPNLGQALSGIGGRAAQTAVQERKLSREQQAIEAGTRESVARGDLHMAQSELADQQRIAATNSARHTALQNEILEMQIPRMRSVEEFYQTDEGQIIAKMGALGSEVLQYLPAYLLGRIGGGRKGVRGSKIPTTAKEARTGAGKIPRGSARLVDPKAIPRRSYKRPANDNLRQQFRDHLKRNE